MNAIRWESPYEKESHPNKCLYCHIDEVERIFKRFVDFYGIKSSALSIVKEVMKYHDHGKLNPAWNFDSNITHSNYSAKYYFEEVKNREVSHETALILYLILHHHGALKRSIGFKEWQGLEDYMRSEDWIKWFGEHFKFIERVNLADLYGLFKISDCLSASGHSYFIPQEIPSFSFERFLPDEKRRKEQEALRMMGRLGFLRAPTGWGKTKASPLYFKKAKKAFLILPTITAINKLYEDFARIFDVGRYFYFYDVEALKESRVLAEYELFLNQHFLKPVIITTVDQMILSFLQVGSYHMKRCMFRESAIVLDEVHLLNPKMLYLLLHFLRKFWDVYNFNILFMSATFSRALMDVIRERFADVSAQTLDMYEKEEYRALRRVKFELNFNAYLEDFINDAIERMENGARVLIICNTVEYAVELMRKIEEYGVRRGKVMLIHARFTYDERRKREQEIYAKLKEPHILISTQVCEVSLDISYDYLYTELAPLPSLIQRFGRVNRGLYSSVKEKPNVFITDAKVKNERYYPYEKRDLEEAKKCLEEMADFDREIQILEKFEEIESKEELEKRLEDAEKDLRLETTFENLYRTGYFFSLDLDEDEARELLSYRESFSTLIIPFGDVIIGGEDAIKMRASIENILKAIERAKRRGDMQCLREMLTRIKGYAVSVPIYWLGGNVEFMRYRGIPIVEKISNYAYHVDYGFIKQEDIAVIL